MLKKLQLSKIRIGTISIILLNLFQITCNGQTNKQFVIKKFIDSNRVLSMIKDVKVDKDNIFEDSVYIVSKSCSGEWGGTIKFKNKQTGIEYSAASTCPVVVNKLNNKYYITNTLAHMGGFSEILEISHPDSLEIFKLPKPRSKKGKTVIRYVGDDESKTTKGTRKLLDSIGILTLASFPYQEKLFHIVTNFEKTFLAKIENNKFVTIDAISDKDIRTYDPEVFKTKDNHFIVLFSNQDVKGYFDIFENKILVLTSK